LYLRRLQQVFSVRYMSLGKNIRRHRLARSLTLEGLAELSGVDVGTISALEVRGSSRSKYAQAIARGLRLSMDELLLDDFPETTKPEIAESMTAASSFAPATQTIGDLAYQIGQALAGLSESRRNTIGLLIAAQVRDVPNAEEARAIDLLTGGVVLPFMAAREALPTAAPLGAPIAEEHRAELDALSKAAEELHENKKQSRRVSRG
jgi:transcriptional regulator with XRE-family HTH domain